MTDCLGNEVTNFVPNAMGTRKGDDLNRYLQTLVDAKYYHVRIYDASGNITGWNKVLREVVDG